MFDQIMLAGKIIHTMMMSKRLLMKRVKGQIRRKE